MIRRAVKEDIGRLDELLFQVQRLHAERRPDIFKLGEGTKKYTDGELEEILADESRPVFVCEREGKVQGYAFCIFQETKENGQLHPRKVLYLDDLCVDAEARRMHVGSELFRYVLDFARETGCDSVTLNVWSVNGEAEAFYERMGMKPLKTTMETLL